MYGQPLHNSVYIHVIRQRHPAQVLIQHGISTTATHVYKSIQWVVTPTLPLSLPVSPPSPSLLPSSVPLTDEMVWGSTTEFLRQDPCQDVGFTHHQAAIPAHERDRAKPRIPALQIKKFGNTFSQATEKVVKRTGWIHPQLSTVENTTQEEAALSVNRSIS